MESREHTLMVTAFGLSAVGLCGAIMNYVPWPIGAAVFVGSLGAALWLRQKDKQSKVESVTQKVEGGLRIVEKELPAGKPKLPHGLRLTISTEVAVSLGLRLTCDVPIPEAEALVQVGRGTAARQGKPASVRESRQAWLFVVRNSPVQRELFLRVDLFAAQPFKVERVDQIRPGGKVALPEWKELNLNLAGEEEAPAVAPAAAPSAAATEPAGAAATEPAAAIDPAAIAGERIGPASNPAGPAVSASPPPAAEPTS